MEEQKNRQPNKAETKKENIDYPNIPASSEKEKDEQEMKKEIKESSKLHDEGKTDNTEKSGN